MRPLPIHRAIAELSFAVDHGTTKLVAARARRDAGATGEALVAFAELAGGVRGVYQKRNKKGTYFEGPVEAEHAMADSLEQLRALEREVEREWW
jgi:hypothetical protein